jgi:hypothetical protein
MNCREVKTRLPLCLRADARDPDDPALRGHLVTCPDCRHAWEELVQLGTMLPAGPEPTMQIDLAGLYREAALRQARSHRRWRWLGLAATLLLALGGVWAFVGRLEVRVTEHEFVLRWGSASPASAANMSGPVLPSPRAGSAEKREEQIEVLAAMVRAMVQELQAVEMRQRRDRADLDVRVSGIQEQSLKRWVALQKDLEALYLLTQKGE